MQRLTQQQLDYVNELSQKLGKVLQEYRRRNGRNFSGIVYSSVGDCQLMSDERAERVSQETGKPPRYIKLGTGDQARVFGVRVVASKSVPDGQFKFVN